MPESSTLAAFVLASAALIVVPGPNLIYILNATLSQGRRAGVMCAIGVEIGTLVHVIAGALGIAAVIASSTVAYQTLRIAGAVYLAFLALRALQQPVELLFGDPMSRRHWLQLIREGALVNLLNPKVVIFFLAFLPQFMRGANAHGQAIVLGAIFALMGLCIDLTYAVTGGLLRGWLTSQPTVIRWQRYFTAALYLSLALVTLLSGAES
ncbi:LysE family translocator [Micromonospora sp. NPDC047707]|uniref:LysE family translocator n=1 Tax=Micromonospora sp. NPDC047707 TaxID=3154498 RepID=UPI0034567E66